MAEGFLPWSKVGIRKDLERLILGKESSHGRDVIVLEDGEGLVDGGHWYDEWSNGMVLGEMGRGSVDGGWK